MLSVAEHVGFIEVAKEMGGHVRFLLNVITPLWGGGE